MNWSSFYELYKMCPESSVFNGEDSKDNREPTMQCLLTILGTGRALTS
jgi:hypothetical protein